MAKSSSPKKPSARKSAKKADALTLPIIYKAAKGGRGEVQFWLASVIGNEIHTQYGKVGAKPRTSVEVVHEGKNLGKKNETTPAQQALAKAQAKWTLKLKSNGYTRELEKAQRGERDSAAPVAMLAEKFSEHGAKMPFPCFGQPKMDGMRLLAQRFLDGTVILWTRHGNILTGLPHIEKAISELTELGEGILDGELYNHALKKDLERIVSLCRKDEPAPEATQIQFWVYDYFSDKPYGDRKAFIDALIGDDHPIMVKVPTDIVTSPEGAQELWSKWTKLGYEGAMLRNPNTPYEHDRCVGLQKVKDFIDNEFPIVGFRAGKGSWEGCSVPICQAENGKNFDAPLIGDGAKEKMRAITANQAAYLGKPLTVKHFGWTKYGVPRHAKGKTLRDYE